MEKLISFAVPSYNSQNYLKTCVESLLIAGDDVEIIIVNDGSTDDTAKIADAYAEKYPNIVRAVHKENGGHGSGVNKGLEFATGMYYKVVDSDDWLDADALKTLIATIKEHVAAGNIHDAYITNFVYEHVQDGTSKVSEYRKKIPVRRTFSWEDTKPLNTWHMFLMHSLLYKTSLLKETGVVLPEHTFYVDNVFAYTPMPYAKKLFYLDVDLYRYYIGRADQSVTIDNIVKRYDQQARCTAILFKAHTYEEIQTFSKPLQKQLYHFLDAILMNTYFFTTAKDSSERRATLKKLWADLKETDIKLYKKLRRLPKVAFVNILPWKLKGWLSTRIYLYLCKHVKLGW